MLKPLQKHLMPFSLLSLALAGCAKAPDPSEAIGMVTGTAIGAALGSMVGNGTGQVVATVAGGVAGEYLGSVIGKDIGARITAAEQPPQEIAQAPSAPPVSLTNCRPFDGTVLTADGRKEQDSGITCQQPDGNWIEKK